MYVTRPLSMYRRSPGSLSAPTPEGPNSGYLVLHDEKSDKTTCFGCYEDFGVKDLPFPQNKNLLLYDSAYVELALIPVLDKSLSVNTYHLVIRKWQTRRGYTNSKEDDSMADCCFGRTIKNVKPKPFNDFNPSDIYQQVEIVPWKHRGCFTAKAVASDWLPPSFLRTETWKLTKQITPQITPSHYQLGQALGLNSSKRLALPSFDFPLSKVCSEDMIVGKWYCPFLFIKEEGVEKDQIKQCMFYETRLKQRWERIFDKFNGSERNSANIVFVDAFVNTEAVFVAGYEALSDNFGRVINMVDDGFMWFKSSGGFGGERSVGLSMKIVERMKWKQERVGWVDGKRGKVRVERTEVFGGTCSWNRFGCYVLVERFVLKRMDGSLALLTYDCKHTHQIRCNIAV